MRRHFLVPLLLSGMLAACSSDAPAARETTIDSYEELQSHLQSNGSVSDAGTVTQPFFGPEGRILVFNNGAVQIFGYVDADAAERDAILIEPDGSSVGETQLSWVDPPHSYRSGKLIVLYVGRDEGTLRVLGEALGEQIAGQ